MAHIYKMHGLGNDFVLLDASSIDIENYNIPKMTQFLCHRNIGIGGDGLLIVLPSQTSDCRMRIINSDGSEAEMCGNGIRCFAKYVYENGIVTNRYFSVETLAGIIRPEIVIDNDEIIGIKVDMGEPKLLAKDFPAIYEQEKIIDKEILIEGLKVRITCVLMGVPHTIVFVDSIKDVNINLLGRAIENHEMFPRRTNVDFVEIKSQKELTMRTWERGAGATLACGTGACASVVAAAINGKCDKNVCVHLELGDLQIDCSQKNVFMTGPAQKVFETNIDIENFRLK